MVVEHNKTNIRDAVDKLSYPRTAIPEGTLDISDSIIIINKQGTRISIFVQPSGHRPEVAVALELIETLVLAATQLQCEKEP